MVRTILLASVFALTLACCSSTKAGSTDLADAGAPAPSSALMR